MTNGTFSRESRASSLHVSHSVYVTLGTVLMLQSGCAVGPDYSPPVVQTPDEWHLELSRGLSEGEANLHSWWTTLDDPILVSLIDRATEKNLGLDQAFGRVLEARALRGVASSQWFPDLQGSGSYDRLRVSDELFGILPPPLSRDDNFNSYGIDASWEIDAFGRIKRAVESADAGLQASVEAYRDLLVILYAEVALNYVEMRAVQSRIRYAESNVETQRGSLQLTEDRLRAQIAPALDVRQAELNLARTESIIPTLRTLEALAIHRLGVLLGEYPSELYDELSAEAPIPAPPETIDISLPANLVRQRPDIRQAERQLAAQTARIGVATADLYPRFSLSGAFAFQATDFGNTFDRSSITYLVGPSVRWNLFNGGRVRNSIFAEDARTKQALARYEESVLLALEEVANALVAYVQESERRDALARSVTAAEQSVELVKTLYRTGLTDFQNVLSMDRSLFVQQDEFAESEGRVTKSLVRVYKALGGGWDPGPRVIRDEIVDAAEKGEPRI